MNSTKNSGVLVHKHKIPPCVVLRPAPICLQEGAARLALLLSEAAHPTAAALVLFLVNIEDDLGGGSGIAWSVLLVVSADEHGLVAGSSCCDLPPGSVARGDGDGALLAGALEAGDLSDCGTFGE